ncbi:MAG TPA: deoxyribose-phosphate aldolase [Frankiaceae bacterium]|nr:deoxyribose-phosphate aldolase [Frankiaceae bacterium]
MTAPLVPPASLASLVDATLLRPDATVAEIVALCTEAVELGAYAVCVSPTRVRLAIDAMDCLPQTLPVAAVCGFPSGAHLPAVKALEAREAVRAGANEIDVVIDQGHAADGNWSAVESELTAVRAEVPGVLKVILETALLTPVGIVAGCRVAIAAGADFVKTSTGFSAAGGATVEAVAALRAAVGPALGVKASGGIRTREQAEAMVTAGASRLGLSALRPVLAPQGNGTAV